MSTQRRSLQVFGELRRLARQRKPPSAPEVTALIARILSAGSSPIIEERSSGVVIRFAADAPAGISLTCLLHRAPEVPLTAAEAAVTRELCAGRTLAQIASLRGVSHNTVKSQVRHIFRKLNVATRVELLRLLGP
jgi:DNA-binding CsgD family transcriptional regulator